MVQYPSKDSYDIKDLLDIVKILRAPGGCPWDAAQTHASIRQNMLEETYEVAEAIDSADAGLLCEELGDLLLQVVLHVCMEEEKGAFTFGDVCEGICKKLIYRHPHVFGSPQALSTGQVLQNWESLKNQEKGRNTAASRLDSVPGSLPALMYAQKLQKRAGDYGFSYTGVDAAMADLIAEVEELRQAMQPGRENKAEQAQEIGDVLFSAANVAGQLGASAEQQLELSAKRFAGRVKMVEQQALNAGQTLEMLDDETKDAYWRQAKKQEAAENSFPTEY